MDALQLSSERQGDSVVITVCGDLDIITSREFDEYLSAHSGGQQHIVLNLAGVDFMDTSSLAVIVSHWKRLAAHGRVLALAAARYRYTRTLWITGLATRLPMYDTVEEATKALLASGDGAPPPAAGAV